MACVLVSCSGARVLYPDIYNSELFWPTESRLSSLKAQCFDTLQQCRSAMTINVFISLFLRLMSLKLAPCSTTAARSRASTTCSTSSLSREPLPETATATSEMPRAAIGTNPSWEERNSARNSIYKPSRFPKPLDLWNKELVFSLLSQQRIS